MNDFKHLLPGLIIILSAFGNLAAQGSKAAEIDSLMMKAFQLGIFNGNVLIVEKGKIVYQSEFGYTDASKRTKLTADYRFNIGSIGKEFNAVGIMMLVEQRKLTLDERISKFLPDLPDWAKKISVRNLLQYTSGLPEVNWGTVKSDRDVLNDLKALKQLDFEPGSRYAYNNNNVFLQRRIIESIAGVSYQKFLETRLLKPCGMTQTLIDPDLNGKNIAVSFNNDGVADPRQFIYSMSGWPSVTAKDLFKWTQCLNSFQLINRTSFREILIPDLPGRQSGLGNGLIEGDTVKAHWHDGQSLDFDALLYDIPPEQTTIILLSNNKNSKLYNIEAAIRSILAGAPYKTPQRSIFREVSKKIDGLTGEEIIELYNKTAGSQIKDIDSEADFNQIGYSLMKKKLNEAIKIFEWNVKMFPRSANAYDSLGEAYLNKGDKKRALINYKKSFELDPKNLGAKEMIDQLEK